ncbi:MAG TPA: hypothetical protein PLB32_09400 [Acidobacteriota bacterium]|nr:hypothetical protein [Acidobacteriota bacterium]
MTSDHQDFPFKGDTTVFVFSHPNHELAIFGLLQHLRPHLIFLTDGGGPHRVEQTRQGLESVALLDRAHFLNHSEAAFYEALLDGNLVFFQSVTRQVQQLIEELQPHSVLGDAVEFYNPVHDLSLPIIRAALTGSTHAKVFEVPLVYQKTSNPVAFEVQRCVPAQQEVQFEWQLSHSILMSKVAARDQIYSLLTAQMGPVICNLPAAHLGLEVIAPARTVLPKPDTEPVLRYEQRARLLLERGEIDRMITYSGHYLPIAQSLWAGA